MFRALILAALSLFGLGGCLDSSPQHGVIEPRNAATFSPQTFSQQSLTVGALKVRVPAGEWRILRVSGVSGSLLYVASRPEPGAQPYFAVGEEVFGLSFGAPPQARVYATPVVGWFRGLSGSEDEVIVLGSNAAATEFAVGYPPPDFDLTSVGVIVAGSGGSAPTLAPETAEALGQAILARPGVPARFEAGTGGYAGTLYRQRIISGDLIEYTSGALTLVSNAVAQAEPGARVLREEIITGGGEQPGRGMANFTALSLMHSGAMDFDLNLTLPPREHHFVGGGVGVGGFVPGATVPVFWLETLLSVETGLPDVTARGIIDIRESVIAEPGRGQIDFRYRFSGREGTYLTPQRNLAEDSVHAFTPDILWVDYGYVNADFTALYGWNQAAMSGATQETQRNALRPTLSMP